MTYIRPIHFLIFWFVFCLLVQLIDCLDGRYATWDSTRGNWQSGGSGGGGDKGAVEEDGDRVDYKEPTGERDVELREQLKSQRGGKASRADVTTLSAVFCL
jgi:hypothetical protein